LGRQPLGQLLILLLTIEVVVEEVEDLPVLGEGDALRVEDVLSHPRLLEIDDSETGVEGVLLGARTLES